MKWDKEGGASTKTFSERKGRVGKERETFSEMKRARDRERGLNCGRTEKKLGAARERGETVRERQKQGERQRDGEGAL